MQDDFVPEESAPAYHPLLAALRSAMPKRAAITESDQQHILIRVQERLTEATSASTLHTEDAITPHRPLVARRSFRLATNLVAALVVVGLLLGYWTLFRAHSPAGDDFSLVVGSGTPVSTPVFGSGPTVHAQVGGLEATMDVLIGGPYFRSELLPVDVSLTNHTQQTVGLVGDDRPADLCLTSALMVQVTAGSAPGFSLPNFDYSCDLSLITTQIAPGQTLTIHQYLPLTKSNVVTVTMDPPSYAHSDPLARHWPSVQIQVNPQVPPDRALTLQQQRQGQATIAIPAGAKGHLLYIQSISCELYADSVSRWTPLLTSLLHEPTCPNPHPHWQYAVSAPGYAIVSGSQQN